MPTSPITKPVRSAVPTFEPVTLAEAKKQCEIADSVTAHDAMLGGLIALAREAVEHDTGIVCGTGTFTLKMSDWPCGEWFEISLRPVVSITSITYVDAGGDVATWDAANYALETSAVQSIVRLAYGATWPTLRGDISGITVTFVAGHATAAAIPRILKHMCLLDIARQFNDREGAELKDEAYERLANRMSRSTYP